MQGRIIFTRLFALLISFYVSIVTLLPLYVFGQSEMLVVGNESTATSTEPHGSVNPLLGVYPTDTLPGGDVIGDFVVGPGKVDVEIKPGMSRTIEMTVANRTGERKRFVIEFEDAQGSQSTDTSIVLLGSEQGPYSLRDYLSVPHMEFELEHSERARVPVTITIPENAEAGGLYGSVLVRTVAIKQEPGDGQNVGPQSAIIARIGTVFFVTIPGENYRDVFLDTFSTAPLQKFFQSGPITFGLVHKNVGSMHTVPYGEIRIHNFIGEEVGFVEVEPWYVLPQSVRLREVVWDRELLFGRYSATAHINRGYDDIVDTKTFAFWVLPWKPILGMFVIFFGVAFLIRLFFSQFEFRRRS